MSQEKLDLTNKSAIRAEIDSYLMDVRKTKQDLEQLFIQTENCDGVYEPFNEDFPINDDKTVWNFDYFLGECSTLSLIFSKERVIHLMEVREYLRQNGCEKLIDNRTKQEAQPTHYSQGSSANSNTSGKHRQAENNLARNVIIGVAAVVVAVVVIKFIF